MQSSTALEVVLKRDRLIVLGGLVGITALAWAYTGYLAWSMDCMTMAMPHMQTWGGTESGIVVCHVDCDDGRHDGAQRRTDDSPVYHHQSPTS